MKYHVHAILIQDIKNLTEQSNITIFYTIREGNKSADFMTIPKTLSNVDLLTHSSSKIAVDTFGLAEKDI
jgi:hypothetical protein